MLKNTLKYNIRTGQFYMMAIFCAMALFMPVLMFINYNLLLIIPFLLQKSYTNSFQQSAPNITLMRISNCNIGQIFLSNNVSTLLAIVAGLVAGSAFLLPLSAFATKIQIPLHTIAPNSIAFLAQSLMCMSIGNGIENSDLRTAHWPIVRHWAPKIVYSTSAAFITSIVSICSIISIYAQIALLAIAFLIWFFTAKSHEQIKYYETFII